MSRPPVLILGGASDIGIAVAHRFAKEGHSIQLAARRPGDLASVSSDLTLRHQVNVTSYRFDALEPGAADGLYDALEEPPGIVICAVGQLGVQSEAERDPNQAKQLVDANFVGPFIALEALARRLSTCEQPAVVVGISSVAGDRGRAINYWYGAAKSAFTTALSGLRQKYARTSLHVVTVKPGFVTTKMVEGLPIPGRLANTADQIAELIYRSVLRRRSVVMPFKWKLIMTVIKLLPERIFMRTRF